MSTPRKGKRSKVLSYHQAVDLLPKEQSKREVLLTKYQQAHSEYHSALDALGASFKAMTAASDELVRNRKMIDRLRLLVDLGPDAPAPELQEIDAPLMTDAEFQHQKEKNPDLENVGKSLAFKSMYEVIGGFSNCPNREPHHEHAAARYLSLYERAQIGGARATDYSMPL